jgi:hypothetical protein
MLVDSKVGNWVAGLVVLRVAPMVELLVDLMAAWLAV